MHEITNQQTHNDSAWRDAESADPKAKPKTQPQTKASNRNQSENMSLEPIAPLVAIKIPARIADKASKHNSEKSRRIHPGE